MRVRLSATRCAPHPRAVPTSATSTHTYVPLETVARNPKSRPSNELTTNEATCTRLGGASIASHRLAALCMVWPPTFTAEYAGGR